MLLERKYEAHKQMIIFQFCTKMLRFYGFSVYTYECKKTVHNSVYNAPNMPYYTTKIHL
jgi:hypothetical protein